MRTFILGGTGLLGCALSTRFRDEGCRVTTAARHGADLCVDARDADALARVVGDERPDVLINAAADVDLAHCERDPAGAFAVNARPSEVLAPLCERIGCRYVYVSTDHFYTGHGDARHAEDAPVTIVNEYARTKRAGEELALAAAGALVVRTNIVGFRAIPGPTTFVEWAIDSMRRRAPVTLFDDYFTSSIDIYSFAGLLWRLIALRPSGIVNLAGGDVSTKKAFVEALASAFWLDCRNASAGSVRSIDGVRRAESCGLDCARAERMLGTAMPGLGDVVGVLARHAPAGLSGGGT